MVIIQKRVLSQCDQFVKSHSELGSMVEVCMKLAKHS